MTAITLSSHGCNSTAGNGLLLIGHASILFLFLKRHTLYVNQLPHRVSYR